MNAHIPYGIYWSTPFAVNDIVFSRDTGLFTGCAAGASTMALVLRVG